MPNIFEKGYHPTTIRDIAQACGMSLGQLYHYISSKDDVLHLVHKHMQNIWYEYLENSDYEEAKDPVQGLFRALHQTLKFMSENRKLIQFIYSESKYLPFSISVQRGWTLKGMSLKQEKAYQNRLYFKRIGCHLVAIVSKQAMSEGKSIKSSWKI